LTPDVRFATRVTRLVTSGFNSSALPGIGAASQSRGGDPVDQEGDARTQGEIEGDGVTSIDPSAWIAIVLVTSDPLVAATTTLV